MQTTDPRSQPQFAPIVIDIPVADARSFSIAIDPIALRFAISLVVMASIIVGLFSFVGPSIERRFGYAAMAASLGIPTLVGILSLGVYFLILQDRTIYQRALQNERTPWTAIEAIRPHLDNVDSRAGLFFAAHALRSAGHRNVVIRICSERAAFPIDSTAVNLTGETLRAPNSQFVRHYVVSDSPDANRTACATPDRSLQSRIWRFSVWTPTAVALALVVAAIRYGLIIGYPSIWIPLSLIALILAITFGVDRLRARIPLPRVGRGFLFVPQAQDEDAYRFEANNCVLALRKTQGRVWSCALVDGTSSWTAVLRDADARQLLRAWVQIPVRQT